MILATLACILERENVLQAWRIIPMRLIYRPMLSYCVWKAILRGIKGAWGKLGQARNGPPPCRCEREEDPFARMTNQIRTMKFEWAATARPSLIRRFKKATEFAPTAQIKKS